MADKEIIKLIEERIMIASESQHNCIVGTLEYEYWKGAHDSLTALIDKVSK